MPYCICGCPDDFCGYTVIIDNFDLKFLYEGISKYRIVREECKSKMLRIATTIDPYNYWIKIKDTGEYAIYENLFTLERRIGILVENMFRFWR